MSNELYQVMLCTSSCGVILVDHAASLLLVLAKCMLLIFYDDG